MRKLIALSVTLILIAGGLFFYDQSRFNDGKLHVVFCDVGQGDATFIRTPDGSDILIDGGPDDSVLDCLSSHMPFWDRSIEVIFLTHPHADHLNGVLEVLRRYEVIHFVTENVQGSSDLVKLEMAILADKNLSATFFSKGKRLKTQDGVQFLTLWPPKSSFSIAEKELDVNGFSLIQLLKYGNFKLFLTGDAVIEAEEEAIAEIDEITVLKVAHHGSKTGTSEKILRELNPKLAIISVGSKNRYGLPALQTLGLLKEFKIKTLRTDLSGEIEIVTDGKKWGIVE